jgi:hypothetical protein
MQNQTFTGATENSYVVNGIPVGYNPNSIERSKSYQDFFDKVGNSIDSIKIFNNFLSPAQIKYFMDCSKNIEVKKFVSQKDDKGEPVTWMYAYEGIKDIFKIIEKVNDIIIKSYDFKHIAPKGGLSVVKWEKGSKLNPHVDDLGYITNNNVAALIYLNDDYEGGEISFQTHDLSIKPKTGDLLIFPGNLHYAHEVKEVLSGSRYTVPIWFSVV